MYDAPTGDFCTKKSDKIKKITKLILTFLLVSLVTTFIITMIALTKGVGYEGSVHMLSREFIIPGHRCGGFECVVEVDLAFNPFLYFISYVNGERHVSGIFDTAYISPPSSPHILSSAEIEGFARSSLAWSEMVKNFPYLATLGFISGFLILLIFQMTKNKIMNRPQLDQKLKKEDAWTI